MINFSFYIAGFVILRHTDTKIGACQGSAYLLLNDHGTNSKSSGSGGFITPDTSIVSGKMCR